TATDMAAYARMLLNRGRADDGGTLLSGASFERFTTPVIGTETPGTSYAYGLGVLEVDGHAWLRHSGGMVGYYALLECDMDAGVGAIMLVNGLAEREPLVRYALAVLRAWKEGRHLPDMPLARDPYAVVNGEELAGGYRSQGREIALRAEGGRLLLRADGHEVALEPEPDTPGNFAVPHPSHDRYALTLERADGKVVALLHGPDRYVGDEVEETADVEVPEAWTGLTGLYRAYNPWFPSFRVYVRGGGLFLAAGEGEQPVEELEEGEFRVGASWSPDRVSFGTVLDGRAQVATYNGHPFWRSFEE
ncbi:MAG: hypothetical protein ACJ758_09515, partial [Actinomycetota bacterium]